MNDMRRRLEELRVRLDALSTGAKSSRADASAEAEPSLELLHTLWDGLHEDLDAVELLGGGPGGNMTAAVEQALASLESTCAGLEAKADVENVGQRGC